MLNLGLVFKEVEKKNDLLSFQCNEERNVFKERKKNSVIVVVVAEIVLGRFFKEALYFIIFDKTITHYVVLRGWWSIPFGKKRDLKMDRRMLQGFTIGAKYKGTRKGPAVGFC